MTTARHCWSHRSAVLLLASATSLSCVRGSSEPVAHKSVEEPVAVAADVRLSAASLAPKDAPAEAPKVADASTPLRGIYLHGSGAVRNFPHTIDMLLERGMNAVVVDGKDYDGFVTYKTKNALALSTKAAAHAPISDLAKTIAYAHERGVRVIMRVSCFHDPWMQSHNPKVAVQSRSGNGADPIGWLDPANREAQDYAIDLIREQLEAGADEIQLDYVRYPVTGIQNSDFKLKERGLKRPLVIRDFVHRVHEVTQGKGVPLSLDVFGVVAFGTRGDVDALGQDLTLLSPECEVLSPMVYPSHFEKGFHGFQEPGSHPEIIGIGTKETIHLLSKNGAATPVRPWIQAFSWRSPGYGPKYILAEVQSAEQGGGSGWLLWNPAQDYSTAWKGLPRVPATEGKTTMND